MILSWAGEELCGLGWGHVNCLKKSVKSTIEAHTDYVFDELLTTQIRTASEISWIRKSVSFFRKKNYKPSFHDSGSKFVIERVPEEQEESDIDSDTSLSSLDSVNTAYPASLSLKERGERYYERIAKIKAEIEKQKKEEGKFEGTDLPKPDVASPIHNVQVRGSSESVSNSGGDAQSSTKTLSKHQKDKVKFVQWTLNAPVVQLKSSGSELTKGKYVNSEGEYGPNVLGRDEELWRKAVDGLRRHEITMSSQAQAQTQSHTMTQIPTGGMMPGNPSINNIPGNPLNTGANVAAATFQPSGLANIAKTLGLSPSPSVNGNIQQNQGQQANQNTHQQFGNLNHAASQPLPNPTTPTQAVSPSPSPGVTGIASNPGFSMAQQLLRNAAKGATPQAQTNFNFNTPTRPMQQTMFSGSHLAQGRTIGGSLDGAIQQTMTNTRELILKGVTELDAINALHKSRRPTGEPAADFLNYNSVVEAFDKDYPHNSNKILGLHSEDQHTLVETKRFPGDEGTAKGLHKVVLSDEDIREDSYRSKYIKGLSSNSDGNFIDPKPGGSSGDTSKLLGELEAEANREDL